MNILQTVMETAFLLPCSVQDVRKKSIPLLYFALGGLAAGVYSVILLVQDQLIFTDLLLCFLPGAFLILLSFITEKKVGYGDGICLLVLGTFVQSAVLMLILFCETLVFCAVFSAVLLILKKADRTTKIPFIPFLLTACVITAVFGEEGAWQ